MPMTVSAPDPPLTDGVVTLRPWGEEGDVEAIVAACNDPAVAEFLEMIPSPYREADAREYLERTREGWADGTRTNFAVVVDGAASGSIAVHWLDTEQGVAEVGYWVAPEARGQGICTRAVRLVSGWVFERPGMERLQLRADEQNVASRKVAEKAGFTQEGILRSSRYNPRLARRIDFVMYSLLRRELGS
jgi:RimJ/RimL family protein N-acetyltransferase